MHIEIKSKTLFLYIEGESLSDQLKHFFNVSVQVVEQFLLSDTLSISKLGISGLECTLSFCDRPGMQLINKNFRQIDKVTDVLSFPVHEDLRCVKPGPSEGHFGPMELGDIIICMDIAKAQADKFNITYEQEVIHLFIHGLLHLVGFDHELSDNEEMIMNKHEEDLVQKIYKKLGLENE